MIRLHSGEHGGSLVQNGHGIWQINFLQHIFTILKQHGRAAIVVPDNVSFEGGAGECLRESAFQIKGDKLA
jgi:type I restriction-modification system DNA methylase subunit